MRTNHILYIGDAVQKLQKINHKVGLVVTSPPYWNIKDYEIQEQIGHGQSYEEYIDSLKEVWKYCKQVLSPGCKLVINIGDQYLRSKDNDGVYEIKPIHADIIKTCQELGFYFLGNIIWRKISTTKTTGGCAWMGSIYYPKDGYITYEHEYVMLFKKPGKAPRPSKEDKDLSRLTKDIRSKWFRGIWDDLPPEKQVKHCAMFPEELPTRIIRMFSFVGETVLDPFVGSGTTMVAAQKWDRNSIGIEINPDFTSLINDRVSNLTVEKEILISAQ